ncbi:DUF1844 domain-containing protein [Truepera radiovictrix]|uniref:DUF1844 domain-containing protein n=1 Tax=Truepera radiovictrix (strain DSM 17093 / CIP 108686 / LMG 22925 / RQ-24) TaxID=649638 RepID=D7CWJ8_TRURR|nr:DUF1844 domain-containing protein [Truepera radiovictrix]ADI14397.1 Domain of unknown function DUF1844 [Truepera radiovictrix DSM 17093]WMT57046.1 DUF1844 domain-containing protein [Truepera radiovictrix]
MADPRFIGLVHSLLSSAEAALGEEHSPMARHLSRDGLLARRTGERSLGLLLMLQDKTRGNLDDTEQSALHHAISTLQARLSAPGTPPERPDAPS